jgi:hypothetical protein
MKTYAHPRKEKGHRHSRSQETTCRLASDIAEGKLRAAVDPTATVTISTLLDEWIGMVGLEVGPQTPCTATKVRPLASTTSKPALNSISCSSGWV